MPRVGKNPTRNHAPRPTSVQARDEGECLSLQYSKSTSVIGLGSGLKNLLHNLLIVMVAENTFIGKKWMQILTEAER